MCVFEKSPKNNIKNKIQLQQQHKGKVSQLTKNKYNYNIMIKACAQPQTLISPPAPKTVNASPLPPPVTKPPTPSSPHHHVQIQKQMFQLKTTDPNNSNDNIDEDYRQWRIRLNIPIFNHHSRLSSHHKRTRRRKKHHILVGTFVVWIYTYFTSHTHTHTHTHANTRRVSKVCKASSLTKSNTDVAQWYGWRKGGGRQRT